MKSLRLFFPLAAILALSACRTVYLDPAGDMQAVYQFGDFKMIMNGTAAATAKATQAAFKQLDLYQTNTAINAYDARIEARTRDDLKVVVLVEEMNSRQAMLRIRVGEHGSLERSREIYEAIEAKLR